ncbi:PREDICTED: prolyl 4-hydroxylase subunit alpha-2-like [Rhagoletis zephyria]|uniref:prolyl 4-hydroxylase subunit alpha-2-like n=1 Tax=Rhagoletis zephyria TaxID=28612 RepID=UPI000811A8C4|nr:PREDICTED: prolyl 4-hydroxylase subunit alpha-2-like [Rhagoletis zephyria]
MKSLHLLALGLLSLLSHNANGDYYTSIASLVDLLDAEMLSISYFEKYVEAMEEISRNVNDTLKQLEKIAEEAEEDPEDYYENPINAYKIISRFIIDWQNLNKTVFDERPAEAFRLNITSLAKYGYSAPTNEDLLGASKALARLQRTYRQETADVAAGDLMGLHYSENFTTNECYWLGRTLFAAGEYKYAAEWLIQAQVSLGPEPNEHILKFLAPSMFYLGNTNIAMYLNEQLLAKDPTTNYGLQNKLLYSEKAKKARHLNSLENSASTSLQRSEADNIFDAVCNGDLQQTPRQKRNLRCRFVHNNVPFRFIAPFKKEELNHDPPVAQFHEIIYDSEIENILMVTEDRLERSKIGKLHNAGYSEGRTSQNSWLHFVKYSFLNAFWQRMEDITGLLLETAEPMQVANYGIGGHFSPHCDFKDYDVENDIYKRGNRLLTALTYINDVELGGGTAFPYLNLTVSPIKRSMLIWYNLHDSLEPDYRTKHGGCPVLVGSKWVLTEWFHEAHQEFNKPCGLEMDGYKSLKYMDSDCNVH